MGEQFRKDLEKAHKAEDLVREVLTSLTDEYMFEDVANEKEYYHKGDIKATTADGEEIMIEVKDDSRIGDTGNILCEESVYYYEGNYEVKGNFYSDYQIYCVLSQPTHTIYLFDFSKLKEIYKKSGRYAVLRHAYQESEVYFLPLGNAKKAGALIKEIKY